MADKKSYDRKRYQENMEEIRARNKKYHQEHIEEIRAGSRRYYQRHKEHHKECCRRRREAIKLEVLTHYSIASPPICAFCGITDLDVLCIDHINNNGKAHRAQVGFGNGFHNWLLNNNFPEGYQILCANCNLKKEVQRRRER